MESEIIRKGIKNTLFVVLAQSITMVLGIAKALILPILLGVTNFGYWQVYLLYVAYAGIFTLGFNDGIYLKYGRYNYKALPKPLFRTSIKTFIIIQIVTTIILSLIVLLEQDPNKQFAMFLAIINIPIAGLTGTLIYVLQITNQFKKYSFYSTLDKVLVLTVILFALFLGIDQFAFIILTDLLSKVLVLGLLIYSCKDLIFGAGVGLKIGIKELFENINIGIKLMLANFTGMLILGFGRIIVERFESVEVFGIYSFAISTMNLVLVFVSSIGLVIYPTLSRIDKSHYSTYFNELNKILKILTFTVILLYFPLRIFIEIFMEEYMSIFEYLPIIFVIVYIQTKTQVLVNPFYKLLRKEKEMLIANIIGLIMAFILVIGLYFTIQSVTIVVLSTLIAMTIRLYLSERFFERKLSIKKNTNMITELIIISIFLIFAYQSNQVIGFLGYIGFIAVYLLNNIKYIIKTLKSIIRR